MNRDSSSKSSPINSAGTTKNKKPNKAEILSELISSYTFYCESDNNNNYKVEWIDGKFESMTGYNPKQIKTLSDLTELLSEDDRSIFEESIKNLEIGGYHKIQFKLIKNDGSVIWLEQTGKSRIIDSKLNISCYYATVYDITEQINYRIASREHESLLRTTIDNSPVILFAINSDGIFTMSEGHALQSLGLKPGQVVGLSAYDVYKENPKIMQGVKDALSGMLVESTEVIGDKVFLAKYNPVKKGDGSVSGLIGIAVDISEKYQAQKYLRESEEKFSKTFHAALDSISITRLSDGVYIDVNEAFEKLTGWSKSEVIGKTSRDLNLWFDYNDRAQHVKKLESSGFVTEFEALHRKKNGSYRTVSMSSTLIDLDNEKYKISFHRDVTDKKEDAQRIQLQADLLNSVIDSVFLLDMNGKIKYVNDAAANLLGYSKDELMSMNAAEIDDEESRAQFPENLQKLKTIGFLDTEIIHLRKDGTKKSVELTAKVITIDNQQMILSITRDITEKKKAAAQLFESNKFSQEIISNAQFGMAYLNTNFEIQVWNPFMESLTGISFNDVMGKPFPEYFEAITDKAVIIKALNEALMNHTSTLPDTFFDIKDTAKQFWLSTTFSPIAKTSGEITGILITFNNISDRKAMENYLKYSEEKFSKAFHNSSDGIVINRLKDNVIIEVNRGFELLSGYSTEEVLGKDLLDFNIWKYLEDWDRFIDQLKLTGDYPNSERVLVKKDGEIIYSLFAAKVFSINNEQYVITTIKDVTEKFYAEQEVHKNKQYLETIFDSVNEAIFILDAANGKILDSNNKASEITGYTPDEFLSLSFDNISINEYPYDRKNALRKFFSVVSGEKDMFEWLAKRKDGSVFWVEVNIRSAILEDEKRLILSARDISERKEAESIIRKSEEQNRILASSLLNSPLAMIYWSVKDEIISIVNINPTAEKILDCTKEDLLDFKFIELFIDSNNMNSNLSVMELLKNNSIPKNITKEVVTRSGSKKLVGWFNTIIYDQFTESYSVLSLGDDITQIQESERMIKESEERYKNLFDFSPEPIFVYKNDTIIFANTATAILLGHNYPDELIGCSIFDYVHPDSVEITKIRQRQMNMGEVKLPTIEQKYVRTDGKIIFVEVSSIPFVFKNLKAVQVVLRDITDRKNSESELRKLSSAVQQSPAAIVITDTKGIITYTNPKFSEITGYTFDESIGKNVNFLNAGTQNGDYQNLWDRISSGKEWRGEFLNKKKSGEIYWEFASISPIKNQRGETTGYLAIKEDITDRKKTEEALIESKLEAEEANKLKSSLLANVSHEFRTPLNGILGFAQLLAEEIPDNELADMAQKIARSGKRLMNTLNSVLMITELENNEYLISKNDTDLNLFCKQLSTQYRKLATEKALNFVLQLPNKNVMAVLDDSLLYKAINHIVENAFKYTFQGEVKIALEYKPAAEGRMKALIHICDTGIGIKKEDQQIIFREFKQLSEGFRRDYEGLGLGLSLSKRIINLIGGDLEVVSEVDKGSCFTITLNNDIYITDGEVEDEDNAQRILKEKPAEVNENITKIPSVLLIEDNQFNIEVVQKFLHKYATVDFARDGFTGIEMAKNNFYDILLIDINLGKGIDGLQVLTDIKKLEKFSSTPMVAITGYASNVNRREFLAQGFTHYLAKPFERRDLLKLFKEIFDKAEN